MIKFFMCQCHHDEHLMKWELPEGDDLTISMFMGQYRNFWQRLWAGIKYICGYKSEYGHWDCFFVKEQDCDELIEILNKYKERQKEGSINVKNP